MSLRKIILAFFSLYLAAILESSFLGYFLLQGRGIALTLIAFLSFLLLGHWTNSQQWALSLWTGFLLDVFCYPGFGSGLLTIIVLLIIYKISYHWIRKTKKLQEFILWFLILNFLFYLLLGPISILLANFIQPFLRMDFINLEDLAFQLLYNLLGGGIIFLFYQKGKRIFLRD
jgi:hypothetical protein